MKLQTTVGLLCLLCCAQIARAQLPAARLTSVFPPGGQRGTSVEVTVGGGDLDGLTRLHVSGSGIVAEPKIDPASGKPVANVFVLRIDKSCPPGAYDVRAVGRFGVTNPRAFVVDREPHAVAKAGNTSPQTPFDLAVNSGVYAVAEAKAAHYYRVNLKSGRRVFVEADAMAIDSKLDPVLVLYDASGRELARDGQGGAIDYTPASDGAYIVEVHDVMYRGGAENFYRLRISDGPRVEFALPAAVRPDMLSEITLFGRNLPGGTPINGSTRPLERLAVRMLDGNDDADGPAELRVRWLVPPVAAMLDGTQRYATAGTVNPLLLARAEAPLVAEQADNDEPAKAQIVTPPVDVYGQFFPRGDHDWIGFDAKKNDAYWIEVTSNRILGFTDPMVLVQRVTKDAKGVEQFVDVREAYEPENVPGMPMEFYAAHRDPAFRFVAPEDGAYRVLVRDLFNDGGVEDDPRRVYRISIAPAGQREDFRLVAWPMAPEPFNVHPPTTLMWGSNLRPGGIMPVSILAFRTGGFGGDITLSAEDLPPGVTCPPVVMNGNTNAATLMLAADENARPFAGAIRIVGTASGSSAEARFTREARSGTVVWSVANQELEPLRSRVAQEFVIAVTGGEAEPIAVRPVEEKVWEESVAGKIEIPLKLTRRMNYAGVVKLKPFGSFESVTKLPEIDVAAGAVDSKWTLDFGALGLPVGNHTVYIQATSTGAYDREPALRVAAQAAKDAADKATAELAEAVKKATEALGAAKTANKPEQIAPAEKALAEANEKVKQNEAAKTAAAERIKALAPKDTLAYGYCTPIRLKVTPAPIAFAPIAPPAPVKAGAKLDVPVNITRMYGFAQPVELSASLPPNVGGLSIANVSIAPGASQAILAIQATKDAKPGDYTLKLSASLKQNDRPLKVEQPLKVTIVAP